MRRTSIICLMVVIAAGVALEQVTSYPPADLLGPHNNNGRGCTSCHSPAIGSFASESNGDAEPDSNGVWAQNTNPAYGTAIAFEDGAHHVEVMPGSIAVRTREVDGILLCVSCHDGNLTPHGMLATQSYEQRVGLLTTPGYGQQSIPTLLGGDVYDLQDHPLGTSATIPTGAGLVWVNNTFTIIPGTPYARFVANYGWPSLVPGRSSTPWGVNGSGEPFVLCTTCHNQHLMTVYASNQSSPIAGDGGGKFYPTLFFVNGPYNPNVETAVNMNANSTTQFCRQCHFSIANEGNNSNNVPTILPR